MRKFSNSQSQEKSHLSGCARGHCDPRSGILPTIIFDKKLMETQSILKPTTKELCCHYNNEVEDELINFWKEVVRRYEDRRHTLINRSSS